MFAARLNIRQALRSPQWAQIRFQSTLEGRPYIVSRFKLPGNASDSQLIPISKQYIFPNEGSNGHVLSLLPSKPSRPELAIGLTSQLPPTPESFKENPGFLNILHEVISKHAHEDPDNISQAQVMVSTSGANLSSGGVLLTGQKARRRRATADSSGGASGQGGVGSAGKGGWIHVFDERRPPEYGRIPWYENDMIRNFGEVGRCVNNWQARGYLWESRSRW